MLKNSFFIALLVCFFILPASAITPEEYCKIHEESGAPGNCSSASSKCVELTTNLGTSECKKCGDGGCSIIEGCSSCADCIECQDKEETPEATPEAAQ